jgi:predicted metalloprotease
MAGIDVSVSKELLPGLLGSQDGLAKLVEAVLNQILEAQVTESLGADRHERSDDRTGYRNGHRTRTLFTGSTPDSFTHGTSAQRVRWFKRGMESGDLRQCDTFKAASL